MNESYKAFDQTVNPWLSIFCLGHFCWTTVNNCIIMTMPICHCCKKTRIPYLICIQ